MPGTLENNKHVNAMSVCLGPHLRDLEAAGGTA